MNMHAGSIHVIAASLLIITFRDASPGTMMCEEMQCENSGICRLVITDNRTDADCVCRDGWVGRTCNGVLKPEIVLVTMTTLTLRITLQTDTRAKSREMNTDTYKHTEIYTDIWEKENLADLEDTILDTHDEWPSYSVSHNLTYSLHYWNTNQISLCHVIAIATEPEITIRGLTANANYMFCAKPSKLESLCLPFLVNETALQQNCVAVRTEYRAKTDDTTDTYVRILILSIIALVALLILIIIIICSFRKKYFYQLMCAGDIYHQRKRRKVRNNKFERTRLLSNTKSTGSETVQTKLDCAADDKHMTYPPAQLIRITPPNTKGKPKHPLTQNSKRGYVSFATINEQTIPLTTVVEDGAEGGDCELAGDNVTQSDG